MSLLEDARGAAAIGKGVVPSRGRKVYLAEVAVGPPGTFAGAPLVVRRGAPGGKTSRIRAQGASPDAPKSPNHTE